MQHFDCDLLLVVLIRSPGPKYGTHAATANLFEHSEFVDDIAGFDALGFGLQQT